MSGYPYKASQIVNYHQQSLYDSSFSVFSIHGASGLGGAPVVIILMLLVAIGYSLAKYKNYAKKCCIRALTGLEIGFKPSFPA